MGHPSRIFSYANNNTGRVVGRWCGLECALAATFDVRCDLLLDERTNKRIQYEFRLVLTHYIFVIIMMVMRNAGIACGIFKHRRTTLSQKQSRKKIKMFGNYDKILYFKLLCNNGQ